MTSPLLRRIPALSLAVALAATLLTAGVTGTAAAESRRGPVGDVADVVRTAGASRLDTAVLVSRHAYPWGSRTVLVARQDHYADALAGGPLAAALEAPILLTPTSGLADIVRDELVRLSPDEVLLLGGVSALSDEVAAQIAALGIPVIERLSGEDRFATAAAIGDRLLAEVPPTPGQVSAIVVEGSHPNPNRGWPDAVAASALAAGARMPIVLATTDTLPLASAAALDRWKVTDVTLVGGERALSPGLADQTRRHVDRVTRIAGADRYETSALAADEAVARGASTTSVWLASGANWPDALVAGPAAAAEGGVLLLSPGTPANGATTEWLAARSDTLRTVRIVGGETTLAPTTERHIADLLPTTASFARWSDPATWGGRVPVAGESVTISPDQRVLLDVATPVLDTVTVQGVLEFARMPGVSLDADVVMVSGRLGIGDAGRPFADDTTIRLHTDLTGPNAAGHAGSGGLVAHGGTIDLFGRRDSRPWTRLATSAPAGSSAITVEDSTGWRAGDRVVLAPSGLVAAEAEEMTVASVKGQTVTLTAPLTFEHFSGTESIPGDPRPVEQRAEVAHLSRSIRVVGADESGGHVMAMAGGMDAMGDAGTTHGSDTPRFHFQAVEFARLGQAGQLGRYPVHFHRNGDNLGSFIRDVAIHDSQNRCLTIHGTNDLRVTGLVAAGSQGHCVFFEDGAETGNVIHDALVIGVTPPSDEARLLASDKSPAAIWIQHPRNVVRFSNVAGGSGFGFWWDIPEHPTGPSEDDTVFNRAALFGVFRGNVAHSFEKSGGADAHRSGTGLFVSDYLPDRTAVLRDYTGWKNAGMGAWVGRGSVTLTDSVLSSNGTGFVGNGGSLTDSLVVGTTANANGRPHDLHGLGLYDVGDRIADVTVANFRPEKWDLGYAIGPNTEHMVEFAELSGIRLVNSDLGRLRPFWSESEEVSTGFVDVDGSVAGVAGATIVSEDAPLLARAGCEPLPELAALRCDGERPTGRIYVEDNTHTGYFDDATLTRSDGATGQFETPSFLYDTNRASAALLQGDRYTAAWPGATPTNMSLVHTAWDVGSVVVTLPWEHPTLHAYDGWGEWARPIPSATSASTVGPNAPLFHDVAAGTVTAWIDGAEVDGESVWLRYSFCATKNCGDGTGSKQD